MLKIKFLFLFANAFLFVFSQTKNEIKIEFEILNCLGLTDNFMIESEDFHDTIYCDSGYKKSIRFNSETPRYVTLTSSQNQETGFYADLTMNKVILDFENFAERKVIGSLTEMEYEKLNSLNKANSLALRYNQLLIEKYKKELLQTVDIDRKDSIENAISELRDEWGFLVKDNFLTRLKFFQDNPQSFLIGKELSFWVRRREAIPYMKSIREIYENMPESYKETEYASSLRESLTNYENSNIGLSAPDFYLKDSNNEDLKLSEFRGKYVLLDFWASWCGPCIQEFPELKSLYKQYSDDLMIIGISRDENLENWREGIQKYEVGIWKQISLKENNDDNLEKQYFVNAIPVKVLINPDGIIIGRWRGGGPENMDELKDLLAQIRSE